MVRRPPKLQCSRRTELRSHRIICEVLLIGGLACNSPARAQFAGLMNSNLDGILSADYKKDNQIRVASGDRVRNPHQIAFDEVVHMVRQKSYSRFAITRDKCESTILAVTRQVMLNTCIIWAKMLLPGEIASPQGKKDQVTYFAISETGVASME